MKRWKVGLDVDDIIFSCNEYAVELTNSELHLTPPIQMNEITAWGPLGTRADLRLKYFKSKKFFETQPVLPGAVEFVHDLQEYGKVFFVTDVQQEYYGIRKSRPLELFPEIPEEHIIITPRKEEANVDVLLDDGIHNLRRTTAEYPVLMQRPWNVAEKNYVTVSGFEEFLAFMRSISI